LVTEQPRLYPNSVDGTVQIADGAGWLPGVYADETAARAALHLCRCELEQLTSWQLRGEGDAYKPVTVDDVRDALWVRELGAVQVVPLDVDGSEVFGRQRPADAGMSGPTGTVNSWPCVEERTIVAIGCVGRVSGMVVRWVDIQAAAVRSGDVFSTAVGLAKAPRHREECRLEDVPYLRAS
jgi:hypothetical protein